MQSLFGHLATRFSAQPENLATESLHYILERSPAVASAFIHFVEDIGVQLGEGLTFETQVGKACSARPDMVACDVQGHEVLIVEAKFWAGLTDNQPVTYLNRLPDDQHGLLLFLAPGQRFETLWPELLRRCQLAGISTGASKDRIGWRAAQIDAAAHHGPCELALAPRCSVARGTRDGRHGIGCRYSATARHVRLYGLRCIPASTLRGADRPVPARVEQYCRLVDDVTRRLMPMGLHRPRTDNGRQSWWRYARFLLVHGFGCWIHFSPALWSRLRPTPLWLSIKDPNWQRPAEAQKRLAQLNEADGPRALPVEDHLAVPLYLLLGVERDQVVEDTSGAAQRSSALPGVARSANRIWRRKDALNERTVSQLLGVPAARFPGSTQGARTA